ncbi:threonine--tRNA ligase [Patescibacteria group bacterium]|nr:threonine--tRNA ligase [Patescibacteria group bacterium]
MENEIEIIRHSLSHVLAASVLRLYPEAKLGIGPSIENGFYYDFEFEKSIGTEDLLLIENEMRKIINEDLSFEQITLSMDKARDLFVKEPYKLELIDDLEKSGNKPENVTVYRLGTFQDLCRGPHVSSTKELKTVAFKLDKVAGAYWKGEESNNMLSRIYGLAFAKKSELMNFIEMRAEAEKRDHKKLGKELGLFIFSDLIGPGLPIYTPEGTILRNSIKNYSNELRINMGYEEVHTPQINKVDLFKKSGHYEKYQQNMFKLLSNYTQEEYYLKPMNCPQHTQIYASKLRSYKDLPIRLADFANLYRDEKPGQLGGLTRLRAFSQDDGHCFCREDQIKHEFSILLDAVKQAMSRYGLDYYIRLSLRDENNKDAYLGSDESWSKSQEILEAMLKEKNIDYRKAEGEAAFYGPKMDLVAEDSLGREWQLSTIQLDFNMPARFGLEYIGRDGKKHTPAMIHSAIVGSPERFMAVLIEHYGGNFPVWLAPVQATILPISDKHNDYANLVYEQLKELNVRVAINLANETLGKKIRESENRKIPYVVVVGDKEIAGNTITVRLTNGENQNMTINDFVQLIVN